MLVIHLAPNDMWSIASFSSSERQSQATWVSRSKGDPALMLWSGDWISLEPNWNSPFHVSIHCSMESTLYLNTTRSNMSRVVNTHRSFLTLEICSPWSSLFLGHTSALPTALLSATSSRHCSHAHPKYRVFLFIHQYLYPKHKLDAIRLNQ